jgi:hypothetical protein
MIAGIVTALVIVFSQLFFFQVSNYNKKDVKTEKQQEQQSDESYISLPSVSQPSSSLLVEGIQKSACLFEIVFEENEEEPEPSDVPLSLSKFFHTLFRVIISPNAP